MARGRHLPIARYLCMRRGVEHRLHHRFSSIDTRQDSLLEDLGFCCVHHRARWSVRCHRAECRRAVSRQHHHCHGRFIKHWELRHVCISLRDDSSDSPQQRRELDANPPVPRRRDRQFRLGHLRRPRHGRHNSRAHLCLLRDRLGSSRNVRDFSLGKSRCKPRQAIELAGSQHVDGNGRVSICLVRRDCISKQQGVMKAESKVSVLQHLLELFLDFCY